MLRKEGDALPLRFQDYTLLALIAAAAQLCGLPGGGDQGVAALAQRYHQDCDTVLQVLGFDLQRSWPDLLLLAPYCLALCLPQLPPAWSSLDHPDAPPASNASALICTAPSCSPWWPWLPLAVTRKCTAALPEACMVQARDVVLSKLAWYRTLHSRLQSMLVSGSPADPCHRDSELLVRFGKLRAATSCAVRPELGAPKTCCQASSSGSELNVPWHSTLEVGLQAVWSSQRFICSPSSCSSVQDRLPDSAVSTRGGPDSKARQRELAAGLDRDGSGQPLDSFVAKLNQIVAADYSAAAMQTPLDLCEPCLCAPVAACSSPAPVSVLHGVC